MKKKGTGSAKGSAFEREVCKTLSLWWTGGERDDVFWRTSGSGARATVRDRGGKATAGQYGDIAATDPIGKPFTDVFTVEIKRGYSSSTFQDAIDKLPGAAIQEWERFLGQAINSYIQAGSKTWMLITRRNRRQPLVWIPCGVVSALKTPCPCVRGLVSFWNDGAESKVFLYGMRLADWLIAVTPDYVRRLAKDG